MENVAPDTTGFDIRYFCMAGKFGDLLDGGKTTFKEGFVWATPAPMLKPNPVRHKQNVKSDFKFFKRGPLLNLPTGFPKMPLRSRLRIAVRDGRERHSS